ncbi:MULTISPECIES: GNAT family N-acetyltransferase [Paenibacillus]|uniref:GNAT family N-acetyltransferase n=1 Tax=Paenibacillus TaxID=44249 RepID=UPI0006A6A692|nr:MULTISPECIES: GNAT family N-acetyltransferase [Paenibacillus]ALA44185.1 TDP-fucosamine acetyltransferase [Paenibacillus peoriae]APB74013.1 dTDP-4-amino-4,6-dideoxy-D-galactose acyltransferase [Paenibacillus polymyxa]OMF73484.1 TDP-fucosamine acetyltransferase [Paenibacillus peoriae]OMF76211.1 TDP-fucosamine acetyltransferase [Paenibacillus peoriae]POR26674.1 GNAT family N-acetyltransferase [Paenibacillus polymyxa]
MLRLLHWDSIFFAMNMAEVSTTSPVTSSYFQHVIEKNQLDFIQALCKIDDITTIHFLENENFHLADTKVTFETRIDTNAQNKSSLVLATEHDFPVLQNMMTGLFKDSRYSCYPHIFNFEKVDELYKLWVKKSITGAFDDYCLVIKLNGEIIGFVTIKENLINRKARIGLLGIDLKHQSNGMGTKLLTELKVFLESRPIEQLVVSTQGRNYNALNLYIKCGYRIQKMESWYYWTRVLINARS